MTDITESDVLNYAESVGLDDADLIAAVSPYSGVYYQILTRLRALAYHLDISVDQAKARVISYKYPCLKAADGTPGRCTL